MDRALSLLIFWVCVLMLILIFFFRCSKEEEAIIPTTRFNTTFDLLTNGGTSKPWRLDSISTNNGEWFTLQHEWYEADYTYYGNKLLTITHKNYPTITMEYTLLTFIEDV